MTTTGKSFRALLIGGLFSWALVPFGPASAASNDTAQATFSATRHEVESVSHDLFERRIFDSYLRFASAQDQTAYRQREAMRRQQVSRFLGLHTPDADYQAGLTEERQFGDAGLHGAADGNALNDDPRTVRAGCVSGATPIALQQARAAGESRVADVSGVCIAAMTQQARSGALAAVYEDILEDRADAPVSGAASAASGLPQKIAEAVHAGSDTVYLGAGQGIPITPALALDAGFVAGYGGRGTNMPGKVADPAKLQAATQACLVGKVVSKTCYVVGFIQGGSAYLTTP